MRKYVILISLLGSFISCSKVQELEEPVPIPPSGDPVHLVFNADAPVLKTELDTDDFILWQEGDAVSVYDGVDNCKFVTQGSGASVCFDGETRETGSWVSVYPYLQSTVFEKGLIRTYIKSAQYSPRGTFGKGRGLSVCKVGSDKAMHFKNAFGLLEFTLSSSDITSVTLSGNSNEKLSGTVSIGFDGETPTVSVVEGKTYVNVLPDGADCFAPGTYYAAVIPSAFPNGITMSFKRASDDRIAYRTSSSSARLDRNGILELGTVDLSLTWSETDHRTIEVEFRDETKNYWPFTSPVSISSSASSPSFAGVPTTFTLDDAHGGHQFEIYAQSGMFRVGAQNQGFKLMGGENDYILLPAVDGKRLSAVELRSGASGYMRLPSITLSDGSRVLSGGGVISSGFEAAGSSYRWDVYDTEFNTRYRISFNQDGSKADGSDAARIQKITLYYSSIPGGNPSEEKEVFGLTEDGIPDFSRVGYHFGDTGIPTYPVSTTLNAPSGDESTAEDASAAIQEALDNAAPGTAVLLEAGTYYVDNPIYIKRSGIVLRGKGESTILKARVITPQGDSSNIVSTASGSDITDSRIIRLGTVSTSSISRQCDCSGSKRIIKDAYCSQMYVCVDDASSFLPGQRVYIFRPGTGKWIHDLHMDTIYPNGGETVQWKPSEYDLGWERTVKAVDGTRIYLDNPLVMSLTENYGGGYIMKCSYDRISECGIENLVLDSSYDPLITDDSSKYGGKWGTYKSDEKHCWNGILIFAAEHCWVSGVTARHMAGSCVHFRNGSRNITVQNCRSESPVSIIQGSRRYAFHFSNAELCLVKDCTVSDDRHAFVTGVRCGGPNVFLRCSARNMYEDVGPHQRWATGCLYDNVSTDYWFTVQDRADAGTGHGWAGANFVLWNCDVVVRTDGLVPGAGRKIAVQSPWVSAKCWAFGCTGEKVSTTRTYKESPSLGNRPDGEWTSYGSHMTVESLYEKQLEDRHAGGIYLWGASNTVESFSRYPNDYIFN